MDFYAKLYSSKKAAQKVAFGMVMHAPELIGRIYIQHFGSTAVRLCKKMSIGAYKLRLNPDL